ncbi:MAG: siderophore-interacting protein [Trueperaceae bacterium]|nr:siderophore-interacting protein [Trueperaceae bacterium]
MTRATLIRPPEPKQAQVITACVKRRMLLSPSFARVTLMGEGLGRLERLGYDQWLRIFMPRSPLRREAVDELRLPNVADPDWYSRYLHTPEEVRPHMRYVTVSALRRGHPADLGAPEVDLDIVVHSEPDAGGRSPLSTWAQTAEPGDEVGVLDQGLIFRPDHGADAVLLIGDETAVPAISGILRSLPHNARGHALIEVAGSRDIQALTGPEGVEVKWITRSRSKALPGDIVALAARDILRGGVGRPYVYAAGESRLTGALGMTLREELAWPKHLFTLVGYWHDSGRERG